MHCWLSVPIRIRCSNSSARSTTLYGTQLVTEPRLIANLRPELNERASFLKPIFIGITTACVSESKLQFTISTRVNVWLTREMYVCVCVHSVICIASFFFDWNRRVKNAVLTFVAIVILPAREADALSGLRAFEVTEAVISGSAEIGTALAVVVSVAGDSIFVLQDPLAVWWPIFVRLPLLGHSEPRLLAHARY